MLSVSAYSLVINAVMFAMLKLYDLHKKTVRYIYQKGLQLYVDVNYRTVVQRLFIK